jgi:hypothetical protein
MCTSVSARRSRASVSTSADVAVPALRRSHQVVAGQSTASPSFGRDFSRLPVSVQRQASSGSSAEQQDAGGALDLEQGGGGGAAANCQVDVRATKISALGGLPVYHLFVIYKNAAGLEYYYRGGPGGAGGPGGYGNIVTSHGRYRPGTVDWAPGAPSVTAMSGPGACGKDVSFVRELSRIDGAAIPYKPTGPNSNSVARTILANSGVPEVKPVFIAPGWGQVL